MAQATLFQDWATADDGQRLAVSSTGEGRIAVVCANGIGVSTFFWKYIRRYFQESMNVVTWDYRGHGKSPLPEDFASLTIEQMAHDMRAVMDHVGVDKALFVGHSMGSQVILEFLRQYPDRTLGLVPLLGTYAKPVNTFFGTRLFGRLFPYVFPLARRVPRLIEAANRATASGPFAFEAARRIGILNPCLCKREDMDPYFEHLGQLDMRVFMTLLADMADHSTADILDRIEVPVLVVGGEQDLFTPVWLSHEMHELIPGSELLIIPGGSHAALVEQPELINLRIEKFIHERILRTRVHESVESEILGDISEGRSYKR